MDMAELAAEYKRLKANEKAGKIFELKKAKDALVASNQTGLASAVRQAIKDVVRVYQEQ
jgi:hypothetical protein